MKYTKEDALKEIRRRAGIIRQNRERRTTKILSTTACLTLVALFIVISIFSGSKIYATQSEYGAFVISAESSGFILAAFLGFVLGVVVTLLIKHSKKKNSDKVQTEL
jgi:fructose-specific phosphotransferase system IIC component